MGEEPSTSSTEAFQRLALQLRDLLALGERFRHRLAVSLFELGLGVEGFQVRRPARHVEVNDPLGLGGMVERLHHSAPFRWLGLFGQQPRVE